MIVILSPTTTDVVVNETTATVPLAENTIVPILLPFFLIVKVADDVAAVIDSQRGVPYDVDRVKFLIAKKKRTVAFDVGEPYTYPTTS